MNASRMEQHCSPAANVATPKNREMPRRLLPRLQDERPSRPFVGAFAAFYGV